MLSVKRSPEYWEGLDRGVLIGRSEAKNASFASLCTFALIGIAGGFVIGWLLHGLMR